jgi:hypothetical protein
MYSTKTQSLPLQRFIGPLFFFVDESSDNNKAMRDGCDDVCTTNVLKEASFSFPIYNPSKP